MYTFSFELSSLLLLLASSISASVLPNQVQVPIMDDTSQPPTPPTIYFGYGSNLWLHQMAIRCPDAKYLGIARLKGYMWIISQRGYANVVEVADNSHSNSTTTGEKVENEEEGDMGSGSKQYDHVVFGLVYALSPEDEEKLDKNEGVPVAYTKESLTVDFWPDSTYADGSGGAPPESQHEKLDTKRNPVTGLKMLVYIDRKRVDKAEPKEEYVYRMNRGIEDAVKVGVPRGYVEGVMRRFIRDDGEFQWREGEEDDKKVVELRRELEEKARRQARGFRDESGVF